MKQLRKFLRGFLKREQKNINHEFKETFPEKVKSITPDGSSLSEWQKEGWVKIKREPIREQLKKMK